MHSACQKWPPTVDGPQHIGRRPIQRRHQLLQHLNVGQDQPSIMLHCNAAESVFSLPM